MEESADQKTKENWKRLLLQYCEIDTMAMVVIFEQRQFLAIGQGVEDGRSRDPVSPPLIPNPAGGTLPWRDRQPGRPAFRPV